MRIETLISTMHQNDLSLINKMNTQTDVLIINQCDKEGSEEITITGNRIRMMSFNERGISKSRNRALDNSNAEVCVIADDDLVYSEDYKQTIIKAYEKFPEADIIGFSVPSVNVDRPTSVLKEGNVNLIQSMKLSSFQITFRRSILVQNGIKFNELFGAGSKYTCGEENILLVKCLQEGLKVIYIDKEIAIVNHNESTWYNGFNEKLFKTKGAMFYEMSPFLSYLLITQFALRKWKLYKSDFSIITAFNYMLEGIIEYKKLKS